MTLRSYYLGTLLAAACCCVPYVCVYAQALPRVTYRAGLVAGRDDDGTGINHASVGGTLQADAALAHSGAFTAGVTARFTALQTIFGDRVCVAAALPCPPQPTVHIQWLAGIGPSVQYKRPLLGASSWLARAFALAAGGVLADDPYPSAVRKRFASLMRGAAVGVAGRHLGAEVEFATANAGHVSHYEWSLMLRYVR